MDEIDPALSNEGAGDESETSPISPQSARKNGKKEFDREKSEREKRTYRACLHCRQRKVSDLYIGHLVDEDHADGIFTTV